VPRKPARVTPETWIATARKALVEEGISGVKVDRLANRLGVTRGGFFHHFRDREVLLDRLILHWEKTCQFLPSNSPGDSPGDAIVWLDKVIDRLISEDGYDHQFDMAVREWSRSDQRAAWAIERADRERITTLEQFFEALGYAPHEALIRARVFYYHQIGYYAIDVHETIAERRRNAGTYMDILCGADRLSAARTKAGVTRLRKPLRSV
jgi:AcrR family transcriptional regulator